MENETAINLASELHEMADYLEVQDLVGEFEELISLARETADHNPLSETAINVTNELMVALKSF